MSLWHDPLCLLSTADRDIWELLSCPWVRGPCCGSGEAGISLQASAERASARVEGNIWFFLWNWEFLSEICRDLRDPLVRPQEGTVSRQVARGFSGFLYPVAAGPESSSGVEVEPQGSSPEPDLWILGFSAASRGVRPPFMWSHASPLSSTQAVSVFLSG